MFQITKEFSFSASHSLPIMPDEHPCRNVHGHNYIVIVTMEAELLNIRGMVLDYLELGEFKDWLDELFDHKHLNDMARNLSFAFVLADSPTAEHLAEIFADTLKTMFPKQKVYSVTVKETPKTSATYYPVAVATGGK